MLRLFFFLLLLFSSLSLLIEFEVVIFCFLKKWERMKLRKHHDVNSLKKKKKKTSCHFNSVTGEIKEK